ncbi:MAG: HAD family hydrolase [Rhodoglobus sp.]
MSIQLALFDLDDTLFAHRAAVDLGFRQHRSTLTGAIANTGDNGTESARWTALEEEHYPRYLSGELNFEGQRQARARGFVAPYGVSLSDAEATSWFDNYFESYRAAWQLHDDALDCLNHLERHNPAVRLGIITNGDPDFQRVKIATVGLTDRIEHVIASGALGYAKPDARIFVHACELFDIDPANALYVGDRFVTDALGAATAGLTGVWLDRDRSATAHQQEQAGTAGVHIIHDLDALIDLID